MRVEADRVYQVKEVAAGLRVSVATIYRAIESGQLAALRVGSGSGAVRITGAAVQAYLRACATATDGSTTGRAGLVLTCGNSDCGHSFEPGRGVFAAARVTCPRCTNWVFRAALAEPVGGGRAESGEVA
jgi:excisionase family DNA binding protein